MKILLMLKLGPLILIVNLFFSISAVAGNKYEEITRDIIKGDLRKFIFSKSAKALPKLLVLNADESVVELNYKEEIIVVNFWATWCAPCKKEMPSLNNLARNMQDEGLRIITVASGRNSKKAIDVFFKNHNLDNLSKYRDPRGKIAVKYGVTALPTTVVINTSGEEIGRIIGDIDWNTEEIHSFFKKLVITE